jgi:hypothetical protein
LLDAPWQEYKKKNSLIEYTVGKYTKMYTTNGAVSHVRNYSLTYATTFTDHLTFAGYTYIKLLGKKGVTGYNVSLIAGFLGSGDQMYGPSLTGFYMRPLETKTKVKFTPEVFLLYSPTSYITSDPLMKVNKKLPLLTYHGLSSDTNTTCEPLNKFSSIYLLLASFSSVKL